MNRRLTVDSRMLAAAALAAVSALVVLAVTRPEPTTEVLVASAPAAAGTPMGEIDLDTRSVADPTGLVAASTRDEFDGHVLLVDLEEGSPVTQSVLAGPETGTGVDVVGVELTSDAAVHGVLEPGDAVDVYVTSAVDGPIARGVTVVGVFTDGGSLGVGDVGVLLAVDDDLAPLVVAASDGDSIHLVRKGR